MEALTKRQGDVLEYIKTQIIGRKVPSFREIMQEFGFKGIKTVGDHLNALEKKGYIKRIKARARSIELLGLRRLEPVELPILGRIAAGSPILAEENIEGTIAIDRTWVKGENSFILKVQGNSMIGAGIYEGDYVIVKQDYTAENNDIVVALVDGEVTLKRFSKKGKQITLKPENPDMEPIIIKNGDKRIRIIGKVTGVYRRVLK